MHVFFTGGGFALGDFVFVVGKRQIRPATVDIEGVTQTAGGHGGALDMPAGTTGAPWGFPAHFAGFGAFPEGKIAGVFLGFVHLDAGTGQQVLGVATTKFAIVGKPADPVVDIAIVGGIGVVVVHQDLHHGEDIVHVGSGAGFQIGPQHTKGILVPVHGVDHPVGERRIGFAIVVGAVENLVVDVGNVAHVGDIPAPGSQVAGDHVKRHQYPGVTDMAVVVNGDTADVHANLARLDGFEDFFLPSQGVV